MRIPPQIDFGLILDPTFGPILASQSSLDGPEVKFNEAYDGKTDSEAMWKRFENDCEMILERLRALAQLKMEA